MNHAKDSHSILNLERGVLSALCGDAIAADLRSRILTELRRHQWREAEHRIVYEALRNIGARDGAGIRERLPAQATRMGFPDVNWESYFARETVADGDLVRMVQELLLMAGSQ